MSSDDEEDEGSSVPETEGKETLEDFLLFDAIERSDAAVVQQAIQDGANVNIVRILEGQYLSTPLSESCERGFDEIVRILLDAGADARWGDINDWSAILEACWEGHLSTVELLLNHDNDLLDIADHNGWTPLLTAIRNRHSEIVRFLLDRGANARATDANGRTALMCACKTGNRDIVRLLLNAGGDVDVQARDRKHRTALHHVALHDAVQYGRVDVMRELVLEHDANMFAVSRDGDTPFDLTHDFRTAIFLTEIYGNKLTHDHGRLALHAILGAAEYSLEEDNEFHPPLNPLRIRLPLGKLTLQHLRTLMQYFDTELIRNHDDSGKLPIHIACRTKAPVEVLALILEHDTATLHIADHAGALPLHECCRENFASVRYLVEQGGVGTLAARNHQGALPLHVLCGSKNPPVGAVQYLIESFPGSVAARTNEGRYPFMIAACESFAASLSVVYLIVRASPDLVVPRELDNSSL